MPASTPERIILSALLILSAVLYMNTSAQNNAATEKPKLLNLDDKTIAEELLKEDRQSEANGNKLETITTEPNQLDAGFAKAAKHGIKPDLVELSSPGSPERVTKVTGAEGSYCVYSPSVARTDGIDEIQNGLQNQVRSCPQ